jgi:hypothetical protein
MQQARLVDNADLKETSGSHPTIERKQDQGKQVGEIYALVNGLDKTEKDLLKCGLDC